MIDISNEKLIPIREVPNRLPLRRSGRPIHVSAIYRWITRGVRGVRLEAVKIGGSTYTSVEALQRFVRGRTSPAPASAPTLPRSRQRRIDQATREAEAILGTERPES